jgi:hypothetical protein
MSLAMLPYLKRSSYPESRVLHGGSIWGKIKSFAGKAGRWFKKTGLISKVAGAAGLVYPAMRGVSVAAKLAGYGRYYRRIGTHRRGMKQVRKYTRQIPCKCR